MSNVCLSIRTESGERGGTSQSKPERGSSRMPPVLGGIYELLVGQQTTAKVDLTFSRYSLTDAEWEESDREQG